MSRICFIFLLALLVQARGLGQCSSGGAQWLNGENDGVMRDTGLIGGYVPVYAVTQGTMVSGRPLYRIGSSTWKGLNYASLQVWRAYSSPGTNRTYFKLDSPLDSTRIHMRVDNIRGDFPNYESQTVRGYLNGVQVAASFKDPVNGATNSGNTIYGGSSTSSSVQSSMRVFFHGPVDSIVVQQASLSDWIIAELMIECDILLPIDLVYWTAESRSSYVLLNWKTATQPRQTAQFVIERSLDGRTFSEVGSIAAHANILSYSYEDHTPVEGKNYYRLRSVDKDGHAEYSSIVFADRRKILKPVLSVYPNPASSQFIIFTGKKASVTIYSMDGRKIKTIPPFIGALQVNTSSWPRGGYLIRSENGSEIFTEKILLR
ncbi:MAG TPA: T9SS type A sorting domain-containing protein [Chitinophagaceae bacterium]|nr:T9SS type A sorting domain-containing protein [Chitinophagaceae bacterium]